MRLKATRPKAAQADFSAGQINRGVGHIQLAKGKNRGSVFFILQAKVPGREAKAGKGDLGGWLSLAKSKVPPSDSRPDVVSKPNRS